MENWSWDDLKPKKKKNKIQRMLEDEDEKDYKGAISRAPLYHRYFEDYSEKTVKKANGRSKIVREYVGKYYTRDCSDGLWVAWKLVYIALFLAGTALYVLGMIRTAGVNSAIYTALPGLLSAIPVVILFATLCSCTVTERNLTKYGYKLYLKLTRWCLFTGGVIAIYGVGTIIYMILNPGTVRETIASTLLAFGAVIVYAIIAVIEHLTVYNETANKRTPDDDSIVIS